MTCSSITVLLLNRPTTCDTSIIIKGKYSSQTLGYCSTLTPLLRKSDVDPA